MCPGTAVTPATNWASLEGARLCPGQDQWERRVSQHGTVHPASLRAPGAASRLGLSLAGPASLGSLPAAHSCPRSLRASFHLQPRTRTPVSGQAGRRDTWCQCEQRSPGGTALRVGPQPLGPWGPPFSCSRNSQVSGGFQSKDSRTHQALALGREELPRTLLEALPGPPTLQLQVPLSTSLVWSLLPALSLLSGAEPMAWVFPVTSLSGASGSPLPCDHGG